MCRIKAKTEKQCQLPGLEWSCRHRPALVFVAEKLALDEETARRTRLPARRVQLKDLPMLGPKAYYDIMILAKYTAKSTRQRPYITLSLATT